MKIGVNGLILNDRNTGIGNYILELLRAMADNYPRDKYVLFVRDDNPNIKYENANIETVKIPVIGKGIGFRIYGEQIILPSLIKRMELDVLFSPAFIIPLFASAKHVVTVHDLAFRVYPEASSIKQRLAMKLLFDKSIRRADHVITVSEATRNDLKRFFPKVKSVTTIHEGVRHGEASSELRPSLIKGGEKFALVVGTITPRKNVMGTIKAFESIMDKTDLNLVFAGGFAWKNREVYEYMEKHGLNDRVKLVGYLDESELAWCYRNARMLLYCSFYEGFGFPPLEAMAFGTPVIASNVSSIPEVVGDAALLVDPYDTEAIGMAVLKLNIDEALRRALIYRGNERYKFFTWEKAAKETRELFTLLGGEKR